MNVDEVRRMMADATPGTWWAHPNYDDDVLFGWRIWAGDPSAPVQVAEVRTEADARFLVNARAAVAALLEQLG